MMANDVEEEVTMRRGGDDVEMDLENVSSNSTVLSLFSEFYKAYRYALGEAIKSRAKLEMFYSSGFKVNIT